MRAEPHLEDWQLIALVRGDPEAGRQHWEQHVNGCATCRSALERFGARMALVSNAISDLHAQPPASLPAAADMLARARAQQESRERSDTRGLLRAAAIILVTGSVVLVQPVRGRLLDWIAAGAARIGLTGEPVPLTEPVSRQPAAGIRFAPVGDRLLLQLATAQRRGTVTVQRVAGMDIQLHIAGGTGEPAATVIGDSTLRIHNAEDSDFSYVLSLPATLRTVDIAIGASPRQSLRVAELEAPIIVELRTH